MITELLHGDPHDQALLSAVRPADWQNPSPAPMYNLVVIGGGTAGLVSAVGAAGLGAKVALVERNMLGGDCLVYGCVPSKSLLNAAATAHRVTLGEKYGLTAEPSRPDFALAMDRLRKIRASIAPNDSAERLKSLGIDVFFGEARFKDAKSITVGDATLHFKRAVIAAGARAASLPVEGLDEAGYLTNETVFNLTTLPRRLIVIGSGPIGCELAQAFRRLGSEVTMLTNTPDILMGDEAGGVVHRRFDEEGIRIVTGVDLRAVASKDGEKTVRFQRNGGEESVTGDEILLAVGRKPNVDSMDLEKAGVAYTEHGITVDDRLRTSNRRVFAAGDIASKYKFTHAADALARIVIQNALFFGRKKASDLVIPWSIYTDPEVAHVGIDEKEAKQRPGVRTFSIEMADVDRAIIDGHTDGFAKVHTDKKGNILGATIVGPNAGTMISPLVLAMTANVPMSQIAQKVLPYPTTGEVVKKLGDAWNRERLTPGVHSFFTKYFRWMRKF